MAARKEFHSTIEVLCSILHGSGNNFGFITTMAGWDNPDSQLGGEGGCPGMEASGATRWPFRVQIKPKTFR